MGHSGLGRMTLRTHRTNLTGAITGFDAAMAGAPIPVVYASSAAVYGGVPACRFVRVRRSNRFRPMEPTNLGASYMPGPPAGCTTFVRSGFVYSTSTDPGRIQNPLIP